MKKLFSCCLFLAGILINYNSYSQCTPDPNCTPAELICPAVLPAGCEGDLYSESVTISLGSTIAGFSLIDITLNGITGLPPGLSFSCNPPTCIFPANSNSCILISGTSAVAGIYPLRGQLLVDVGFIQLPVDTPIGSITINAKDCAGECGGTATVDNCGICSGGLTGILPNCDDGNLCTTDSCDGSGGCTNSPIDCDDLDACTDEVCDPLTGCAYSAVNCDDGDSCTIDGCDFVSGCTNTADPLCINPCDTITCDDGDDCTTDACDNGLCSFTPISCDDGNECTNDFCQVVCQNTPVNCDDGDACTDDACDSLTGICSNTATSCDDLDLCTGTESCDPLTGCVSGTPLVCDDNNLCTDDTCDPLAGCSNTASNCDDGDSCTIDACDFISGCSNVFDSLLCGTTNPCDTLNCNDNDACTDDVCDPLTLCSNASISCDDGDSCTIDACDFISGCSNVFDSLLCSITNPCDTLVCDDNDACTDDVCDPLTLCSNTAINCDDSDACTDDACDAAFGCAYTPVICDDSDACTDDACDAASGCAYTPVICDDSDACTDDACDAASGCTYSAVNCDDSDACTDDACDAASGCAYTPVICDDSDACTDDACDAASGCAYTPVICDDTDACTDDACDATFGCAYTPVICDDSDACTDDACDAASGCAYTPVICDDSDVCTDDACDAASGCAYTPVICDDSDACTDDACDAASGCAYTPVICDDSDACTDDACDAASGCTYSAVNCDDGDACTIDACDAISGCQNTLNKPELAIDITSASCEGDAVLVTNLSTGVDAGAIYYLDVNSNGTINLSVPAADLPTDTSLVLPVSPGTYSFTIYVVNSTGCSDTLVSSTTVLENPVLAFDISSACEGQDISITNLSTGVDAGATYSLDVFNDGTIDLTLPASDLPTDSSLVLPAPAGTFDFTVYVVNSTGCSDTLVSTITVLEKPVLAFDISSACEGQDISITNLSTGVDADAIYSLDVFNDGTIDLTLPASGLPTDSSLVLPAPAGTFDFTVYVVNSTGCSDTLVSTITVLEKPVLAFDYQNGCAGDTTYITNLSTGVDADAIYYLDLGSDGSVDYTIPASSLPADSAAVLPISGNIDFTVIVVNSTGCSDTFSASIVLLDCNDNDACTDDACDAVTGCTNSAVDCNDSDACTDDACDAASGCTYSAVDCNDSDACTDDACDAATGCAYSPVDCNDSDACTDDACDAASGCAYSAVDCNDSDACTDDACDAASGCAYTPVDCNDSDACTDDACDAATGCTYSPVDCNDSDACTDDACDAASGCAYTPVICDDSDACTDDACDAASGCAYTPVICDDSDACTDDACDAATGCTYSPVDCNDSDACTDDACDATSGCAYTPVICDDSDDCTDDACDPLLGCVFTPVACDDSDLCTTDKCEFGVCVFVPINCNDGDLCTSDLCVSGSCVFNPISCDDADSCTIDACDLLSGCTNSPDPICTCAGIDCNDNDACTIDSCNNGVCENTPVSIDVAIEDVTPVNCQGSVKLKAVSASATSFLWSSGETTSEIDATPGTAYSVTASVASGCDASASYTVPAADELLSSYVLLFAKEIGLSKNTVLSGGVGLTNATGKAKFGNGTDISAASTFVKSKIIQVSSTSTVTNQINSKATVTPPAFEFNTQCGAGPSLQVPDNSTVTLSGSLYKGITIGKNCTVSFSGSEIDIEDLYSKENTTIRFTAPCVKLRVCKKLQLGASNTFNPDAADLVAFVELDVTIEGGSTVIADIHMLGGKMTINKGTQNAPNSLTGLFTGNLLEAGDYTTWQQNTTCNPACLPNPPAECNPTERRVYSFTLVSAASDLDIAPLNDGDVIDLALTGSISVRANVCNDGLVESVKFFLDGSFFKVENIAFYSIAGDNNGNYNPWNVQPGTYTITATPYSGDNGSGTPGTSYTVTITIINSALKTDGLTAGAPVANELSMNAFPNPFSDKLNIEFTLAEDSRATLELFNVSGQKLATLFDGFVKASQTQKTEFTPGSINDGMIIYRLQTQQGTYFNKVLLVK